MQQKNSTANYLKRQSHSWDFQKSQEGNNNYLNMESSSDLLLSPKQ